MDSVLYLISEDPGAHGIFDCPTETKRMVFCRVRSVTRSEFYRAMQNGIHPSFMFHLADALEYQGEKICEYNGQRLRVVRAFTDATGVELTVEEATVDA